MMSSNLESQHENVLDHKYYKCCIVPICNSTTITAPNKLFFNVPKDAAIRKKWCLAMKRDMKKSPVSAKSTLHICEDHFNLMQDMENYMQYQLMGQKVKNLRLKTGVIPHIFTCQKPKINPPERHLPEKRRRLELIMDAEMEAATSSFAENRDDKVKEVFSEEPTAVQVPAENIESMTLTMDKNIQVNLRPKFRSKATNTREICTSIGLSPIKIPVVSIETSAPLKPPMKMLSLSESTISSVKSVIDEESDNLSQCSSSSSMEFVNEFQETEFKEHMLKGTLWSIERDPKLFLGLPLESYHLIKMLAIKAPLAVKNILITLKKIRLNDSFAILAINFGTSISNLSRIFDKSVVILSGLLQQLIYWPDRKNIRRHLPIPFRARYGNVVSLIDCLEIQIEKPSNPIHQALTWSEYKKGNTIKYLISCTPDGLVSFISKGYGGRATDVMILEDSGYVNQLQPGVAVMADRGFKNVVNILQQRDCVLIRPPSVSATTPSSADEVKQSKQIAALRVHVERVIGRLREFNMLLPHACVDNHLISRMDHVIVCACAIINCQKHLFKLQF